MTKSSTGISHLSSNHFYTPLIQNMGLSSFEDLSKAMSATTPVPPYVERPEDIAYAYLYLASDESTFMTGADITVDGGASIV